MSETRYKVVFNGELVPGADLEATKDNLATLFKSDRSKIESLFSSPNVAIKRELSEAEAQKYVDVLARAGIKTHVTVELASTLSLIKTEEHDHLANQKRMTCPKCQAEQPESPACSACGIVIEKYLARQEQLNAPTPAAPSNNAPFRPPQADLEHYSGEYGDLNPFTIQGRIGRLRYLAWSLVLSFAIAAIAGVALAINPIFGMIVLVPAGLAAMVVGVFMSGQRLHDIGWSAWLMLIMLVPFIGGFFSFVLMLMPGTQGHNQYGAPPPPNSTAVTVLAVLYFVFIAFAVIAAIALPAMLPAMQ